MEPTGFPLGGYVEGSMTARDAYVRKLKEQLDRWNAEISKLDA